MIIPINYHYNSVKITIINYDPILNSNKSPLKITISLTHHHSSPNQMAIKWPWHRLHGTTAQGHLHGAPFLVYCQAAVLQHHQRVLGEVGPRWENW